MVSLDLPEPASWAVTDSKSTSLTGMQEGPGIGVPSAEPGVSFSPHVCVFPSPSIEGAAILSASDKLNSTESQGVGSFVYFPSQACLLNNSIHRALAKPNLILRAILQNGKDRRIKINKPPILLSRNFLSWQEEAGPLLSRGGDGSWAETHKLSQGMKSAVGTVNKTQRYSLWKRVKISQVFIKEEAKTEIRDGV